LLRPDRLERLRSFIDNKREELNVQAIQVIGSDGPIAQTRVDSLEERALRVSSSELNLALVEGMDFTETQRIAEGDLIRGGVPIRGDDGSIAAVVVVDYVVPSVVSEAVRATARTHDEYRQLGVLKQPIVNSYTLTLLLITLVVLLAAIWFAFTFAKGFTVPIQALGEGMTEVAQGNFDHRAEAGGDEEFAPLFDSFNTMAAELQATHSKLDERRSYIENVLRNITAGVLSVDESGLVATLNPAAGSMLNLEPQEVRGQPWKVTLSGDELAPLCDLLAEVLSGDADRIERQLELAAGGRTLTAWVTAIRLVDEAGVPRGATLFLEDVSYLLRVERMEAWRDVARRIAHEIKNPLTPIQLSAQRLQKRFGAELGPEKGAVLEECTGTIIGQVEQLKRLVNEFSNFARLPAVQVATNDLGAVVEDALVLFREGHDGIEFDLRIDSELPTVEIDPEAIQRVVVNLLDNAVAATRDVEHPRIEIAVRYEPKVGFVHLEVADNGAGIPPQTRRRIFEPYFSTKSDGTGLGLAIVATIVAEHRAYVRVRDNRPCGTRFVIDFPVRDRSSLTTALRA
jgi:two-component system nitrogen regulation sensor histidine kinase NtrY